MKRLVFILLCCLLGVSSITWASPGPTDKDGCHTCEKDCARWGLKPGEFHCHATRGQLNVSYDNALPGAFDMKSDKPVKGLLRYVGFTADGLAALDLIGDKKNLSSVTLSVTIPQGDDEKTGDVTLLIVTLLNNMLPKTQWEAGIEFFKQTVDTCTSSPDMVCEQENLFGEIGAKIKLVKPSSLILLTFAHQLNFPNAGRATTSPPASTRSSKPPQLPVTPSTATFSCSPKKSCKDMGSCEEALFHLNTCGNKRLDRDGDGVPCESICPGG